MKKPAARTRRVRFTTRARSEPATHGVAGRAGRTARLGGWLGPWRPTTTSSGRWLLAVLGLGVFCLLSGLLELSLEGFLLGCSHRFCILEHRLQTSHVLLRLFDLYLSLG